MLPRTHLCFATRSSWDPPESWNQPETPSLFFPIDRTELYAHGIFYIQISPTLRLGPICIWRICRYNFRSTFQRQTQAIRAYKAV
jgi:hypothetical protein